MQSPHQRPSAASRAADGRGSSLLRALHSSGPAYPRSGSTIGITLDTYSHAIPSLQESAAETVAALMFGGS